MKRRALFIELKWGSEGVRVAWRKGKIGGRWVANRVVGMGFTKGKEMMKAKRMMRATARRSATQRPCKGRDARHRHVTFVTSQKGGVTTGVDK